MGDERGRDVQDEGLQIIDNYYRRALIQITASSHLASVGRLGGELEGRFDAMSEEVSLEVEELRILDERCNARGGQMRLFELLGDAEIGDEGPITALERRDEIRQPNEIPMVAGNDNGAGTSLLPLLHEIDLVESLTLVGFFELLSELVVSNSTGVDHRLWGENILHPIQLRHTFRNTKENTYCGSTSSVLGSASGNICDLVVFDELGIAFGKQI